MSRRRPRQRRPRRMNRRRQRRTRNFGSQALFLPRAQRVPLDPPTTGRAFWRLVKKRVPVKFTFDSAGYSSFISIKTTDSSFYATLFPEFTASSILSLQSRSFKMWGPVSDTSRFQVTMQVTNDSTGTYFDRADTPGRNHRAAVACRIPQAYALDAHSLILSIESLTGEQPAATAQIVEIEYVGLVLLSSAGPVPTGYKSSPAAAELIANVALALERGDLTTYA